MFTLFIQQSRYQSSFKTMLLIGYWCFILCERWRGLWVLITTTNYLWAKGGTNKLRRVCFISPEYWPLSGGTGAYVYYLSNELLKNGYKIYVVTGSNQTLDVQVNEHLNVFFLKIPRTPIVKSFMLAAASNRKLNRVRHSIDLDITHPNLPLTPNFAVPPNFGKTLICTVHSTWKGEAEAIRGEPYSRLNANEKFLVSFNWFLRIFEERMLRRARKIIAVSHFTKWELVKYYKIPEDKIRVIHNGVDVKQVQASTGQAQSQAELGLTLTTYLFSPLDGSMHAKACSP